MSGFSTYLENIILNYAKGTQAPTPPTALWVALFNGDPTDLGTGGAEVTTTIRTAGRLAATFGTITSKTITNIAAVDFGNAAAGASITHFGLFDAATGGNMHYSNALTGGTQVIGGGTDVAFAIGAISVSVD